MLLSDKFIRLSLSARAHGFATSERWVFSSFTLFVYLPLPFSLLSQLIVSIWFLRGKKKKPFGLTLTHRTWLDSAFHSLNIYQNHIIGKFAAKAIVFRLTINIGASINDEIHKYITGASKTSFWPIAAIIQWSQAPNLAGAGEASFFTRGHNPESLEILKGPNMVNQRGLRLQLSIGLFNQINECRAKGIFHCTYIVWL